MQHFIVKPLVCAGFLVVAAGCQSSPSGKEAAKPGATQIVNGRNFQQLIVKFKSDTFRCDHRDITRLAAQIDVVLDFVRPMSGDACVIRQIYGKASDFSRGQKLLEQHPSIEWVEVDAVMKKM